MTESQMQELVMAIADALRVEHAIYLHMDASRTVLEVVRSKVPAA